MANGQIVAVEKRPSKEGLALAALVALGGITVVVLATRSQGGVTGPVNTGCLQPGEGLSNIATGNFEGSGIVQVHIGDPVDALTPSAAYIGPGRDVYTAARIIQRQGDQLITVYGSGIAGIHLFPASTPVRTTLVPPNQPEPQGAAIGSLRMYEFPGPLDSSGNPTVNPICGYLPVPGPASIIIEVFGRCSAADADGYSSTTCNNRVPLARREYIDKVMFV